MANYDFTYTGAEIQAILDTGKKLKDSGYIFLGVATPSTNPGTPTQKVYYEAKQAGTYTNFGGIVLPEGLSLLKWNGSWTSETMICGDGGVFDISVYKASGGTLATFADLSAALNGGNNIPVNARKGGMSVKFVQSSDNKYIQARCMAQNFTTDVTQWQGVDEEPIVRSKNLVTSGGVENTLLSKYTNLGSITNYGANLFNKDVKIQAYVIDDSGNLTKGGHYDFVTQFIPYDVSRGELVVTNIFYNNKIVCFCYDKEYTFLGKVVSEGSTINPSSYQNTAFIRFNYRWETYANGACIMYGNTALSGIVPYNPLGGRVVINADYSFPLPSGSYHTLDTAIAKIPASWLKLGTILVFRSNTYEVSTYQYIGTTDYDNKTILRWVRRNYFDNSFWFVGGTDVSFLDGMIIYDIKIGGDSAVLDNILSSVSSLNLGMVGYKPDNQYFYFNVYKGNNTSSDNVLCGCNINMSDVTKGIYKLHGERNGVTLDVVLDLSSINSAHLGIVSRAGLLLDLSKVLDYGVTKYAINKAQETAENNANIYTEVSNLGDNHGVIVLKNKIYQTNGTLVASDTYDTIIKKIGDNVYMSALGKNAVRRSYFSGNPLESNSYYLSFSINNLTANSYEKVPDNAVYVAFSYDPEGNDNPPVVKLRDMYKGMSKDEYMQHLSEAAEIENYDYASDINISVFYHLAHSKMLVTSTYDSFFVKIKNGTSWLRVLENNNINDMMNVCFFSDLPSFNDTSSYISGYATIYGAGGIEVPPTAKYAIVGARDNNGVYNNKIIVRQVTQNKDFDAVASSVMLRKTLDIGITLSDINNTFGQVGGKTLSSSRGGACCEVDATHTFVGMNLLSPDEDYGFGIMNISDDETKTSVFTYAAPEGYNCGYVSIVKDSVGVYHVFFAEYNTGRTDCYTKHYKSTDGNTWVYVDTLSHTFEFDGYTNIFMASSYNATLLKSGKIAIPVYDVRVGHNKGAAGICLYDTENEEGTFYVFRNQTVNEGGIAEIADNVVLLSCRTQDGLKRITLFIDLNEANPSFKYFDRYENIISPKNTEILNYNNNLLTKTKIARGTSVDANTRYDMSLWVSVDFGKSFSNVFLIHKGQTLGDCDFKPFGNGYVFICSTVGTGEAFHFVKTERVY